MCKENMDQEEGRKNTLLRAAYDILRRSGKGKKWSRGE